MASIYGYGAYVPKYRIRLEEIARIWGEDLNIGKGLVIDEKTVVSLDEDAITIAVEAGKQALTMAPNARPICAVHVGTESKPYAVKPSSTVVAAALGLEGNITAADYEFACKAGTEAIQTCISKSDFGLAIGVDTAQAKPGDALEYSAASGGAAFIIGPDSNKGAVAKIEASYSFVTDTPDFWRKQHAVYPEHANRFTGEPAYFRHVVHAANALMQKTGLKQSDFDYAVFHMPNGKFPLMAAKLLGFPKEKLEPGFVVQKVGNTYAGCSLLGLAATLDSVEPGKRILVVSFGSGAGSDAFSVVTLPDLAEKRKAKPKLWDLINNKKDYIDYANYCRLRGKIKMR